MQQNAKTKLRPGTVQTIREQLEFQLSQRPEWVAYQLPAVEERRRVEYSDIEELTSGQAESVRSLLVNLVVHHQKRVARERATRMGLLVESEWDPSNSEWAIRVRLLKEALADLCSIFTLVDPLGTG